MNPNVCPHCRTQAFLSDRYSVLFSFDAWPFIFSISFVVLVASDLLVLDWLAASAFTFAAILPLTARILRKKACSQCGIEFQVEDGTVDTSEA